MKELIFPYSKKKGTLDVLDNVPTINITENGEYNVKGYDKAVVNVEGGGSSDFSTAEVSITNNRQVSLQLWPGTLDSDIITGFCWDDERGVWIPENTAFEQGSYSLQCYVRTGEYICFYVESISDASRYIVTGNAEVIPGDPSTNPATPAFIKVTGDCTITIPLNA